MSLMINDPRHWLNFVPETLKASPLYSQLWERLKEDPELLAFVNLVDPDQPNLVTFFTGVNFLLLREPEHLLARYYPSLHSPRAHAEAFPASDAYPVFRAFVLAHRKELHALLPTARLQTNEVTRCCNLLPAFVLASQRGGEKPLNMIEIGSSAGFNLLWNRYHYAYTSTLLTDELTRGESTSPVHLHCVVDGAALPPLPEHFPRVALCQGIELLPRDLSNEADMRWVRAAIWPEERARHYLLDAVIRFARQTPFLLHKGDACDYLPALLAAIPEQHTAVVWHSYAVHQGPLQVQERIEQQLAAASHKQTIYRISLEFIEQAGPTLELMTYAKGRMVEREYLANCAVHGERMTWLLPS